MPADYRITNQEIVIREAFRSTTPSSQAAISPDPRSLPLSNSKAILQTAMPHGLTRRPGLPLPEAVRLKMESAFCADFASVRVLVGSEAAGIGAVAFAHGEKLFFAPGFYSPHTYAGQQLLGHELAHVLQQRAGIVKNPFGAGVAVVHDDALEAEADRMGHLAASYQQASGANTVPSRPAGYLSSGPGSSWLSHDSPSSARASVIQCAFTGLLADKLQLYFQTTFRATYTEFNALKKSPTQYSTNDQVILALQVLRAARPVPAPIAPVPPPLPLAVTAIPSTWTSALGALVLYRAVDLTPGKIKHKGRFSPRTNPIIALPDAIRNLLNDPRGFAEEHVRANKDFIHSAATDETCAGYQAQRDYVYRITIPLMHRYTPPDGGSQVERPPIIWANSANRDLAGATMVAFDPRKITNEVDLIFDITLTMIDAYKPKGAPNWTTGVNWNTVVREL
jgi:hypothetical protein